MKRAILFTAITALILGLSGLRSVEAAGALNHGPRLTVKVAKPGMVQKAHHRKFRRNRGHRISRGWGHRFSRGRGHRFSRGRGHRFSRGQGHRFSRGRGYHRHYYRLFSGAVVTRWHRHRWFGYRGRQFSQRRHHRPHTGHVRAPARPGKRRLQPWPPAHGKSRQAGVGREGPLP